VERDNPEAGGGLLKRSDIRVGVLLIEGTNCEDESVAFFRHLGARAEKVHLKQLTGDAPAELQRKLDDFDILMIPGGFAAGDYVRAGAIFAARLRSRLAGDLAEFVGAGKPVFGVCNGFQVLVEAGLLPALGGTMTETPEAVLATNDSGHYECRPSLLRHDNAGSCAFTQTLRRNDVVTFISAHAEGKLLFPKDRETKILRELAENDQVVFRFVDDRGRKGAYPWNPSGTTDGIAALCNRDGNVFGVQPHPERCFFRHLRPDWTRAAGHDAIYGDGQPLFDSVLQYVEKRF
jgi:phosphoribosylformylglycinamidine synthase I